MVISTCSFTLNGPGLSVNSHFRPLKNTRRVTTFAIKCPSGTTAIWAEIELMVNGSRRYQKNWLRKERRKQASAPRSHVRNVTAAVRKITELKISINETAYLAERRFLLQFLWRRPCFSSGAGRK
nr:predicted protein [Ipomoea batatas]